MKLIIHDLDSRFDELIKDRCDRSIIADGRYAPCQGCFHCWTKHPAECFMKDSLQYACRKLGEADDLVIITRNSYGGFSPDIKNILDRCIGTSTPFSTYRKGQMHHTLRYGWRNSRKVIVYGDITDEEKDTFRYLSERNAVNEAYKESEVIFIDDLSELEALI